MSIFSKIKGKITTYLDVYIRLIKVNFIGQTANILSYFLFAMICLFILFAIILFTGFGVTESFIAMGIPKLGAFFITVGVYVLLLALVLACRKGITNFFASGVITVMTEQDDAGDQKETAK